mgnify:CR=1 FL=1
MGWKDKPSDPAKVWINSSIEIQILLACGWDCHACDQLSNYHGISFVKKGTMTVAQIQHFVDELKAVNGYFGRARIVGGEPTGHPKLAEIIKLLHSELVATGHIGHLEIVTNGDGQAKLEALKPFIQKVRVSNEKDKQKHHSSNMRATPSSLGYEGKRCGQPEFCGWSLSYYGFAPCSSGAGIMRLRDLMPQQQVVSLPVGKTDEVWPQLQQLCNNCYHGLKDEDKVKCGTGTKPGQHALNTPNEDAWSHLAPWLMGRQPNWPIYGQPQERSFESVPANPDAVIV